MPKKTSDSKPWERQQGESEKAFEAFALYRDMGTERSLRKVEQELGKSRTLMCRWSSKYQWCERAREYDNDKERQAKKEAEKGLRDMYARQTEIAMSVQTKALKALDRLDPDNMSAKDIREFIKMATDLERLNRTFAAGQEENAANAHSLADTIIAAYEKRKEGEGSGT